MKPSEIIVLAAIIAFVGFTDPASAAVPEDSAARSGFADPFESGIDSRRDPLVERVQSALARKELYFGPIDGRYGPMTEDAIRRYQRSVGFPVDGRVTEDLVNQLETGEKVTNLLKKLDSARQDRIEKARQALLANPETRHLVTEEKDAVADPTRDPSQCFDSPTPYCLLAEAAESGKAIPRDEMRDWALKELLVAQARAGLTDGAMTTARRVVDPRLIMVALRDIAEALAASGFDSESLETARIIPDPVRKAEAFTAIARIWTTRGKSESARSALAGAAELIDDVAKPLKKATFQADLAVLLARNGNGKDAEARIKAAQDIAMSPNNARLRGTALRHVAATLAEMGRQAEARGVMLSLDEGVDRTPILVAVANAQAESGNIAAAAETAGEIKEARYRAVVLADIAFAHARAGALEAAHEAAEQAERTAGEVRMPFARSYAQSRIAAAKTEIGRADGGFDAAVASASAIKDDRLRAQALWSIAAIQKRSTDTEAALRTQDLAETAAKSIKSPLSRIWLYADMAVRHAAAGERGSADDAFAAGIAVAREIGNPWARTRALSRLAVALIEIDDPSLAMAASQQE